MGNCCSCFRNCCNCCSCFQNCCTCLGFGCCCRLNGCCSCFACQCCFDRLLLPQQDPKSEQRKEILQKEREDYSFEPYGGLAGMPMILKGTSALISEATFQQFFNLTHVGFELLKGEIEGTIREILAHFGTKCSPLDEYKKLFRNPPAIADTWTQDTEFGYLRLAGLNPTRIFQINEANMAQKLAPDRFNVTDEFLAGLLPEGVTLARLAASKRLFMTESPETADMQLSNGNFVTAPIALYWLNEQNNQILPLAIQLYPDPTKGAGRIYTPKDKKNTWLAAKIHVAYTDMMIHSFNSHVFAMHTMMESIWIAMCRCLSEKHPLRAFFDPHFYQLLIVNFGIRKTLDPDGSLEKLTGIKNEGIVELVHRSFGVWSAKELDVDAEFAKRGVESIPNYCFRDDCKAYYNAVKSYARSIVKLVYTTPNDMIADYELKDFLDQCAEFGVRDLPKADSPDELAHFIAGLVFHATVRHSYVETAGFALYSYPPASPLKFTLPPTEMTADADLDDAKLQSHLATLTEAVDQIKLIRSVEIRADDNYYIGNYNCRYLAGLPGGQDVVEQFVTDLKAVDANIAKRNQDNVKKGLRPFTYFQLHDIYSSIWN